MKDKQKNYEYTQYSIPLGYFPTDKGIQLYKGVKKSSLVVYTTIINRVRATKVEIMIIR